MQTRDPFEIFEDWFSEAKASEPNDPNAMALATVDADARPSSRMVLLKGHGPDGFVFYTNANSRKGSDLSGNAHVALLFHWKSLRRQIRIEGAVSPVANHEADSYFASRGRDSQLGAWASDQSSPLESRDIFLQRFENMKARFDGQDIPRPPHWSGFRVIPEYFEFWKDGAHRLHERYCFERDGDGWSAGMLYP